MQERFGRRGTFAEQRTGLVQTNRFIVIGLVAACAALSFVWFVFVSGYWQVTSIEVSGLQSFSREEVASTTYDVLDRGPWKPWDRRNIFFIEAQPLADALRERLFAEEVHVDKVYPNILRLILTERQRSVVLASKDQFLLVDTNGIVTGEAADAVASDTRALLTNHGVADQKTVPVVLCPLNELATTGYQIAKAEDVRAWIEAYKELIRKGMRFRYLKLDNPASQSARLVMEAGYDVLIDMSISLDAQISTYKKFVQAQTKDFIVHEYIDVRVPGKIFLK